MENYELCHWGIKGMKWGVRRYQNKDGSLTPAGRKRYDDDAGDSEHEDYKRAHSKSVKSMSDQELRDRINRLNMERQALDLERQISSLTPKEKASGESFIKTVSNKVIGPALMDAGKRVLTDFANKKGRELLGLDNNNKAEDPLETLRKTAEELRLKKSIDELKNPKPDDPFETLRKTAEELKLRASIKRDKDRLNDRTDETKTDADKSDTSTRSETKSEPKVETAKAEIVTPTKSAFTPSNSNAKSVHQLYEETYNKGRTTVDKMYSSGYSMTPISKLESYNNGSSGSNNKALLSTVGGWTMRSLEDMEKYN